VELFKRKNSSCWWYDFTVRGERFRGSTKESNKTAASAKAAQLLTQLVEGRMPAISKKAPVLTELASRFLAYVDNSKLADKSKIYLRSGWRLLKDTEISRMRINDITSEIIDRLQFPGSEYNINCALKTLRRMLHLAKKRWGLISYVPDIKLAEEKGRSLRLDEESERKLLSAIAEMTHWKPHQQKLLQDVIILIRDTGMRNKKELFRMRIEDIDFTNRTIFVPNSKTPTGRRYVPMSDRVFNILSVRCGERRDGWLLPGRCSRSGHLTTVDKLFREARAKSGLPNKLVLYCGRHDFGTELLRRTGNLALVMKVMGQKSIKAAMAYQHPELDQVRLVLNERNGEQEKSYSKSATAHFVAQ
jgi:integrase